ncbi:MAG: 23S rRNA (adenine(2030)-N(6))-methyltransferase RlmJ [Pseudomonadales bacterium]|nr:23S rRNA (adenine(2030)-N(6))-methyltransferase RlmJ [Pseudomonadales bacterium]
MLSYRHSYHAGNFADVLKHIVQIAVIEYLKKKDKPFTVHDTHGGAGGYLIDSGHMQKTGEYRDGIERLWDRRTEIGVIDQYVKLIRQLNPAGKLREYPGSPQISASLLRDQDRLQCTELHSTDFELLQKRFAGNKQVRVEKLDAWQGIKAMLPPTHRRGMVLIDPSYELEKDYTELLPALQMAKQRWSTATYAIWYPVLDRNRTEHFVRQFVQAEMPDLLRLELCPRPDASGRGMTGSGMLVINPPYTLAQHMAQAMPALKDALCETGGHTLVKQLTGEAS